MSENYFLLLGLPESFDVDIAALEKRYFDAQKKFHPDRVAAKTPAERQAAISQSMQMNAAYETLKSPLKRANYMLSLHGITSDGKPSQALIMEVMELRESLAEVQDTKALLQMESENQNNVNDVLPQLSKAFETKNVSEAHELAIRLSYLYKIADEIRLKKKTLQLRA